MLVLTNGKYTGKVVNCLSVEGSIISSTLYSADEINVDWHCHENFHVSYVFQGGESRTRGESVRTLGDQVFFYRAGERHRWIPDSPVSKSANIEVSERFLKKIGVAETELVTGIKKNSDVKFLILKMQQEMLQGQLANTAAIQTLLLELVSFSKSANSERSGARPDWVARVKEMLDANWNRCLSLDELALEARVHPVTISKRFRRYFGCTLGEYVRKLKVERSLPLVKESTRSLTEIALMCGFSDQSHFSRTFKQITGFSPYRFRKF